MGQIPGGAKQSWACLSQVSNGSAATKISARLTGARMSWCLVRHCTGISCYIPPSLNNPFHTEDARK